MTAASLLLLIAGLLLFLLLCAFCIFLVFRRRRSTHTPEELAAEPEMQWAMGNTILSDGMSFISEYGFSDVQISSDQCFDMSDEGEAVPLDADDWEIENEEDSMFFSQVQSDSVDVSLGDLLSDGGPSDFGADADNEFSGSHGMEQSGGGTNDRSSWKYWDSETGDTDIQE
jgi:hypothetical protein